MPVPTDPYTFVDGPGNTASGVQVNERFKRIYDALNPAVTGLDWSNVQNNGLRENNMATGANGLAKGAFSAYRNAALSLTGGGVVVFDTELFDVSGWFDTATGVYTPQVPGFCRLSAAVWGNSAQAADLTWRIRLQRNPAGAGWADLHQGQIAYQRGVAVAANSTGTWLVQANGTTDAFRIVVNHDTGAAIALATGAVSTYFHGELIGRS